LGRDTDFKMVECKTPARDPLNSSSISRHFRRSIWLSALTFVCAHGVALAGSLDSAGLQAELTRLTDGFDGRVGVCALDATRPVCIDGGQHFSMQSVMKLVVGMAVMDVVEDGQLHLQDAIVVRREDVSGSWRGVTAATNDVGILRAPDGGPVSLVVFIGDSRAPEPARAALIAQIAAAVTVQYH
jgi:beta-lactamase class A